MPTQVQVIGLKEANRALRSLPDVAKDEAQKVFDVTAFQVARLASTRAPRSADGSHGHQPGYLRSSIQWQSRPRSLSAIVGIAVGAFYWKFVEFGTRKMSARPFLRPAADELRGQHKAHLVEALKRAANTIASQANG